MAKIKVQAQHLQPGDIVGSGEKIREVQVAGCTLPSNKVRIYTDKRNAVLWGKYTQITVERGE